MKRIDYITLTVEGIPCSGCAMDDIDTVDFSIATNTIKILYDTGEIKVDHVINRQEKKEMKPAVYPGIRNPVTERNVNKNSFLDNHSYIFY